MSDSIRDLMDTPEYRQALKDRILAGTAKTSEINLARELGVFTTEERVELSAKQYLARMDPQALAVHNDLIRVSMSAASQTIRVVRSGGYIGIVYPDSVDANKLRMDPHAFSDPVIPSSEPVSAPASEDDLMPARPGA